MTELEQKFTNVGIHLLPEEYIRLIKNLIAERDSWMENAKNWEKENKKLQKYIDEHKANLGIHVTKKEPSQT